MTTKTPWPAHLTPDTRHLAPDPHPFVPMRSGRIWDLVEPDPAAIHWPDVAWKLSGIARFNGEPEEPYSVAQHSLDVAGMVSARARLHALVHDAHEAAIGDIMTPVKQALARFGGGAALAWLDALHARAVHLAAGAEWPVPDDIAAELAEADMMAMRAERRDLMPPCRIAWGRDGPAALAERRAWTRRLVADTWCHAVRRWMAVPAALRGCGR